MKFLPSDQKYAGLNPRLNEVLEIVYAKRPLLEYQVVAVSSLDNLATSVYVWQDGQKIGTINAAFNRYSEAHNMNEKWFAVESPNIKKERGRRHTKFSKDAKTAARTIIEMFTKKPLAELGKSLIADVKDSVMRLHDRIEHDYKSTLPLPSLTLTNYFIDTYLGKNPPLPKRIADEIVNKDMLRKRENLDIAVNVLTHCKNNNGYAIKVMQDETLLFTHVGNPDTTSKCKSTYDLDQYSQEKYTMLKLLDVNQFAADIGVKYEQDDGTKKEMIYFIVAGETKVIS